MHLEWNKTSKRLKKINLSPFSIWLFLCKPNSPEDPNIGVHMWDCIFQMTQSVLACFSPRQGKRSTSCRVSCGWSWMEPFLGSRIRRLWTRWSSVLTLNTTAASSGPTMPELSATLPRSQLYVSCNLKHAIQVPVICSLWLPMYSALYKVSKPAAKYYLWLAGIIWSHVKCIWVNIWMLFFFLFKTTKLYSYDG